MWEPTCFHGCACYRQRQAVEVLRALRLVTLSPVQCSLSDAHMKHASTGNGDVSAASFDIVVTWLPRSPGLRFALKCGVASQFVLIFRFPVAVNTQAREQGAVQDNFCGPQAGEP